MTLPDIIIGGVQRSGTTFLARALQKHPDIYIPNPLWPEPKICLRSNPKGVHGYRELYLNLFATAPNERLKIEKTANYFESQYAPQRLKMVTPNTRYIFVVRNPLFRAWSNWKYSTSMGHETLSFKDAILSETDRRNPDGESPDAVRPYDYLTRSHYGTHANRWVSLIGRDRIMFLLFEEMVNDPEKTLRTLQSWLGVTTVHWNVLRTERLNATGGSLPKPDTDDKQWVRHRLSDEIELFRQVSGLDLTLWAW